MQREQIRAAIIGAGGVARSHHAPGLARLPGVQLVAICDLDPDRAASLAEQYGARSYTQFDAMLDEVQPDIVHVCTPETAHTKPVLASLRAGAHVFCEKVMAAGSSDAWAMVREALKRRLHLAVDYNYRYMPAFVALKRIISEGELGRVALFNVHAHSYCVHHALDLLRFLGGEVIEVAAMHTRWDRSEEALGAAVGDLVYCPTRNEGLVLRFADDAVATLSGSLHMDLQESMLRMEVVGERGRATVDGIRISDVVGRLRLYPSGHEVDLGTADDRAEGFDLAFRRSIATFVADVREGTRLGPSGIDGLRAVEVEEAIVRSQRARSFVPMTRLACGSLAFAGLSLEEALLGIADLGIPYADLALHEGWAHMNPSVIADQPEAAWQRVERAVAASGVKPISFNVGLGTFDPNEETRRMRAVAALARRLGVRMVTLPGSPQGTPLDREVARCRRLVAEARPLGVEVTLETHVGHTTEDPSVAAAIVREVPHLGLTLDPSHYYAGASQGAGFQEVLPYVRHVHWRDGGRSPDQIQLPVGRGVVDFDHLLLELRRHGYRGDFVIEYIEGFGELSTRHEVEAMRSVVADGWVMAQ